MNRIARRIDTAQAVGRAALGGGMPPPSDERYGNRVPQ
jgi:hypothetical protein